MSGTRVVGVVKMVREEPQLARKFRLNNWGWIRMATNTAIWCIQLLHLIHLIAQQYPNPTHPVVMNAQMCVAHLIERRRFALFGVNCAQMCVKIFAHSAHSICSWCSFAYRNVDKDIDFAAALIVATAVVNRISDRHLKKPQSSAPNSHPQSA